MKSYLVRVEMLGFVVTLVNYLSHVLKSNNLAISKELISDIAKKNTIWQALRPKRKHEKFLYILLNICLT